MSVRAWGMRWRSGLFVLAVLAGLAACTRDDDSRADRDRQGGFYGGVSGGMARP